MAYADFDYYEDTFLGTAIASTDFPKLALDASAFIDRITFNRAAAETDVDTVDKIKKAMCAVAEELQTTRSEGNIDGISSESIGNYSISYNKSSRRQLTIHNRLFNAAALWLSNTQLLYAGFLEGE